MYLIAWLLIGFIVSFINWRDNQIKLTVNDIIELIMFSFLWPILIIINCLENYGDTVIWRKDD